MPWFTTDEGNHVNTDWFDKEDQKKYAQIEENRKQAKEKQNNEKAEDDDKLYRRLKDDGYRVVRGKLEDGKSVVMVNNGQMSDGSLTYVKGSTVDKEVDGLEPDGYVRQYLRDRHNIFYLMTEDKY